MEGATAVCFLGCLWTGSIRAPVDASAFPSSRFTAAAGAFRRFFRELREAFLEREALFSQLELALLAREHVLVIGPPGTGKSAVAGAALGRIVDAHTGAPSLFSRQLTETTVQTDLVGPVDFKVLTETGRTEYLTDEGMLGAAYAFLDEVFDGRDMLLRSLLNTLHERELKHGRKVTRGRTSCAVMTSNRYLSEVVARSPELLLAFADRLAFVCFVPRSFARTTSRAAMLERAVHGQLPKLRAPLTLQDVEVLQEAVEHVRVPAPVLEAVERLASHMEQAVRVHTQKLADYVQTRSFSQRSLVKALWVLKAAVVHDCVLRRPDRPLEATPEDLRALGCFFGTGGPPPEELEVLLKGAVDPRERSQLEGVRAEARAFSEALAETMKERGDGVEREATELQLEQERGRVEALGASLEPSVAAEALASLRKKLVPGPRHGANRSALLSMVRTVVQTFLKTWDGGAQWPSGTKQGTALLGALDAALLLSDEIPELRDDLPAVSAACSRLLGQVHERVALVAEAAELVAEVQLDELAGVASSLALELKQLSAITTRLLLLAPDHAADLREREVTSRRRTATALRRRATIAFQHRPDRSARREDLAAAARSLRAFEGALRALDPTQAGVNQELLEPIARVHAQRVLSDARFTRLEEYARVVQGVVESLRKEGVAPGPVLASCTELIERRLLLHARALQRIPELHPPTTSAALQGEAYTAYREHTSRLAPDGELSGLDSVAAELAAAAVPTSLSASVREAVANAELASLEARAGLLRSWLDAVLASLPSVAQLRDRAEAERGLDRLVRSRFPLLTMREGELMRLSTRLSAIVRERGAVGEEAQRVGELVSDIGENLASVSQRLLGARAEQ